jgi:hypothetical protein
MMKVKRNLSTDARVKQLISKEEPAWSVMQGELVSSDIANALSWYSQNKDKSDAAKYLTDYCKENNLKVTEKQIGAQPGTLGFIARMVSRGAVLQKKEAGWFKQHIISMRQYESTESVFDLPKSNPAPTKKVPVQDQLKMQTSKCMGDLEGAIDEFILSDFKKTPNTLDVMRKHNLHGPHGPNVVNFFKKYRDEFRLAIAGTDPALEEGYSNYTTPQMKKMEALYDQIISDALTVMGESMQGREPRKKKVKSPEAQVKSLKYCAKDDELNIISIPPTRMVGAEGVLVYHRNSRMLSFYIADDASGLGVKGCMFTNYSKTKSRTKKLRKPEEVLPKIVKEGKVYLKNVMDNLTTKDGKVNGRMGKEVLLVRVIV